MITIFTHFPAFAVTCSGRRITSGFCGSLPVFEDCLNQNGLNFRIRRIGFGGEFDPANRHFRFSGLMCKPEVLGAIY